MYKDFLVGKIFRIVPAKGKCTRDLVSADGINYVAAKKTNNGVADRCSYIDAKDKGIISEGNCIVFVQLGDGSAGYTTYQPEDFVGMNGKIACGYIDGVLNEKIGMYLMATLDKNKQLFSYSASWTGDRLRNTVMSLPVKVDEDNNPIIDTECKYHEEGFVPNFDYMQERIAELEQERIAELEQERITELEHYLIATGLNDYELTEEDKEMLATKLTDGGVSRDSTFVSGCWKEVREFKVSDLFVVEGTKSLDAGTLEFEANGVNFVGRTDENNGVQGKIEKQYFKPNGANTLTATVIGNYKYVKYQEEPYYCSQNINKLTPIFPINNLLGLYFRSIIQKFVSLYDGKQGGYKINEIKEYTFELPIQTVDYNNPILDSERKYHPDGYIPDWDFMEKYIRAIEKVVIADVVKYKDEVIALTKTAVA